MEALGIDIRLIAYQLVNFALLFGLLTAILSKPLMKMLDERRKEIERGLADAAKAREQLEHAEERQRALIAEAEKQGKDMIESVRNEAAELRKKLEKEAAERAEKMLKRAEDEIAADRARLKTELRGEIADMVVKATGKVIGNKDIVTDKSRDSVDRIVKEIA